MRGRPFEVIWREEDTTEALKATYRKERDIELRIRLPGLWLLRSGRRLSSVAATVGVHYRTVQTWVGWYRKAGVAEVVSHKMGGKGQVPFLSDEAQIEVAEEVSTGRIRTAGEIRDWVSEQYGVTYKTSSICSLMSRLKCAPKVPSPMHAKADAEQQASWEKGGSNKP